MTSSRSSRKSPPSSVAERRDYPRISSRCVVDLRPVDEKDPVFSAMRQPRGILQNISGGGVCLVMQSPPPQNSSFALKIHLPGFESPVMALGKVVWTRPNKDAGQGGVEVGIEFWWVGWEDARAQEQIRGFIARSLSPHEE